MSHDTRRVPLVAAAAAGTAPLLDMEGGGKNVGQPSGVQTELQALDNEASGQEGDVVHGGLSLEWENIEAFVPEELDLKGVRKWGSTILGMEFNGAPTKRILKGASGFARSGEVLAVMGPSGSGKTTLLNILAQRPTLGKRGYWQGQLRLNGAEPWKDWEREMAYVMQKDIFYEELKVSENLLTTALLRLPYSWSRERKLALLDEKVRDMGLEKVKNTKIGSAIERGLSGGELKRTSIVNEYLAMPRIFLLDEPLTGLDSSRAVEVMTSLRRMAHHDGTTVMLTIHQPSSSLYNCFDRLLLLGPGGRTAYFGDVAAAVDHFASIGRPVPALWAPSDHYIELLAGEVTCDEICDEWSERGKPERLPAVPRPPSLSPMPPFSYQVRVLLPRAFKRIVRTYLKRIQWKMQIALSLVWGFIYFNVGNGMPTRLTDFVGAAFFIVAQWSWTPLFQGLGNFPQEKDMLTKEKASRTYRIGAFFWSQVLAEALPLMVFPTLFFLIVWPMCAMPWQVFMQVYLLIALNIQVCSSMSMCISAFCMDQDMAINVAIVTMVLEMCTGGYFADMRLLPAWLSWVRFLSFYYYTFGSVLRLLVAVPYGEEYHREAIAKYSFSEAGFTAEILALAGMAVLFRLAAYLTLSFTKKLEFS